MICSQNIESHTHTHNTKAISCLCFYCETICLMFYAIESSFGIFFGWFLTGLGQYLFKDFALQSLTSKNTQIFWNFFVEDLTRLPKKDDAFKFEQPKIKFTHFTFFFLQRLKCTLCAIIHKIRKRMLLIIAENYFEILLKTKKVKEHTKSQP